jgi:hypothetical protein
MPSWRDAQLKKSIGTTLHLPLTYRDIFTFCNDPFLVKNYKILIEIHISNIVLIWTKMNFSHLVLVQNSPFLQPSNIEIEVYWKMKQTGRHNLITRSLLEVEHASLGHWQSNL